MKIAPAIGPLLLGMTLLFACDKEEEVPSFIKIQNVELITDLRNEGSASHNIVDAWVFVNDELLGAYGLPANVPALYAGSQNVKIIAGVKKNGIASTRIQYPFYTTYEIDLDLARDESVTIDPVFNYFDGLNIWFEDFDGQGFDFEISSQSDTILVPVNDPDLTFEDGAGGIFLDADHPYFRCHTDDDFNVTPGEPVLIEMDYRNNDRILVGATMDINGSPIDIPVLFLNPSTEWNKIYIDMTGAYNTLGTSNREFYIEVLKSSSLDSAKIYIDNVKFIRY